METPQAENLRRIATALINSEHAERERLEAIYGQGNVWNTDEMRELFEIESFMAPCCFATRKSDRVKGFLTFQHEPRYYFDFQERK